MTCDGVAVCAGHLMSRGVTLGIMGREVLSMRDCTRDAEWKLMHVTLLSLSHSSEVSKSTHPAERTLKTDSASSCDPAEFPTYHVQHSPSQ